MKKPSPMVVAIVEQFLADEQALGEKLKHEYKSYYGFTPGKGKWGSFNTFLSAEQLADQFQVGLKTLERQRAKGEGPKYLKVSKQVRYPLVELDNWVREQLVPLKKPESPGADQSPPGV